MKLHADEPAAWPSDRGWQQWWRHQLVDVEESTVDADGFVLDGGSTTGDRLHLTAGQHLRPGALYQARLPQVTIGAMAVGIDGPPGRRLVHGKYQHHATDRFADLDLDGLDDLVSVRSTSTLAHLGWTASFTADRDRLLDAEVALDWLRATVQARVVGPHGSERLVVDATVRGAGPWRPVIAPLLAAGSRMIARGFAASVRSAAERMRTIDQDPTGRFVVGSEERTTLRAAQVMRERAVAVEAAIDARPWWRRRTSRAWMRALAALPQPQWPARSLHFGDWASHEQLLHQKWFLSHRSEPPATWIGDRLMVELAESEAQVAALVVESSGPNPVLTDEMLGLAWLRSPWSTVRFLGSFSSDDEAKTAVRDMLRDEDL